MLGSRSVSIEKVYANHNGHVVTDNLIQKELDSRGLAIKGHVGNRDVDLFFKRYDG